MFWLIHDLMMQIQIFDLSRLITASCVAMVKDRFLSDLFQWD